VPRALDDSGVDAVETGLLCSRLSEFEALRAAVDAAL
jgi:hypothetical protein